jgi:trehalose 6-phosphate phosphatase
MTITLAGAPAATLPPPPRLDPARIAIFTDLDGTLATLQATPCAVGPDPERRRLLAELGVALRGRLAVVSGRALDDIDRVLEGEVVAVGAVHGLVRRTADGAVELAAAAGRAHEAAAAFQALAIADPGLLVEDKGAAVALHYRGSPKARDACRELAARLAGALGLAVQEGDHVVELRAPGPDKGGAIRAFMQERPFVGHTPVFLGDDLTDEAGFDAVAALGGHPVIVGPRRPTRARYALPDVAGAHAWLRGLLRPAP